MSAAGSAKPQGGRGGGRYGPHGGRGGGAQQATCNNCGNSGHYGRNCPVALKPFLQQVKDGKVPPRAGVAVGSPLRVHGMTTHSPPGLPTATAVRGANSLVHPGKALED